MPPSEGFLLDTNLFREIVLGNRTVLVYWQATTLPIYLSSIAVEEILAGYMANLNRARSGKFPLTVPTAHDDLISTLKVFQNFDILTYSPAAESVFASFSADVKRRGTQDCRIAAQAIAHNLTVVTRNLQDFQRTGALCVDWTQG